MICAVRVPVNDPSGRGPLRGRIEKEAECRCYIGSVDGIADQSIQFQDVDKAPERDCEGQSGHRQAVARRIKYFSHGGRRSCKDSAVHIGQFRLQLRVAKRILLESWRVSHGRPLPFALPFWSPFDGRNIFSIFPRSIQ